MSVDIVLKFLERSLAGETTLDEQIVFLTDLNEEGITPDVMVTFVNFLREHCDEVSLEGAIDICGTGGSGLPRINTSTISAFILSSLGVKLAKHGNKAASGRFGSFDLLEGLGMKIELDREEINFLYDRVGLAFLYARSHHPVMKHFAEARMAIGKPTIFNLLGPLLSPAKVKRQIIGTAFEDKMELIAETCKLLGQEKVMVVRGRDGLDEVTLTGFTQVVELKDGEIIEYELRPEDFGAQAVNSFNEIAGGDDENNMAIARDILKDECSTSHVDLVCVNAALALVLAGKAGNLKDGYSMAHRAIKERLALDKFYEYRQLSQAPSILKQIVAHKRKEVSLRGGKLTLDGLQKNLYKSERDFGAAVKGSEGKLSLIAEVKKASPSDEHICTDDFDPVQIALEYERVGAAAISVLCDEKFFQGSLGYLKQVSEELSIPVLCKDFIIDLYQIYEARFFGADAVLLIAAVLNEWELKEFIDIAESLGMDALVEVHDEIELKRALRAGAKIIGINNRDLHSFTIDLKTTARLAGLIPEDIILVSESGFASRLDAVQVPKNVDALLVGTSLMKSKDRSKLAIDLSERKPLIKICGVRSLEMTKLCESIGVDMVGFNFVPASKRKVTPLQCLAMRSSLQRTKAVGVFQNQPVDDVNRIAAECNLDFVQLSGIESPEYVESIQRPVIKAFSISDVQNFANVEAYLPHVSFLLFDGATPGSGEAFDHSLLRNFKHPFIIAGGISPENAAQVLAETSAIGIDTASGIETDGVIDQRKIQGLYNQIYEHSI